MLLKMNHYIPAVKAILSEQKYLRSSTTLGRRELGTARDQRLARDIAKWRAARGLSDAIIYAVERRHIVESDEIDGIHFSAECFVYSRMELERLLTQAFTEGQNSAR